MLFRSAEAHGLRAVALRYFNVAGSTSKVRERHSPETHLIPLLVAAARSGEPFKLFGDDYPTDDGSAVRDYVHVADVADAHVAALAAIAALPNQRGLGAYLPVNIGSGRGTSVYEVIRAVERATGRPIDVEAAGGRVARCLEAVWRGDCESDSLHRLIVRAGLEWQQVELLRAYRKYHHRVNAGFPVEFKNDVFAAHPDVAAGLVRLFSLRFDPAVRDEAAAAAVQIGRAHV